MTPIEISFMWFAAGVTAATVIAVIMTKEK